MTGSIVSFFSSSSSEIAIPDWLLGMWDRDDVYVMTPDQDGDANDGLTTTTSWPNILRYPCKARASATYPSPNGTKAYPDGVKVIVFLPGDYSMRKMHSVRPEEYWPHWDSAPDSGLEPSVASPLMIAYANEYGAYGGVGTHPTERGEDQQADFAILQFSFSTVSSAPVYVSGIRSSTLVAPYAGLTLARCSDGRIYNSQFITELAPAITLRFGSHRNIISNNYGRRDYPWSYANDYPGINIKDPQQQTITASSSSGLLVTYSVDIPSLTRVRVASRGTLPTGLAVDTDYWTVRVSSTTSRLATSYANAQANTVISYTDAGTGRHTLVEGNDDNIIEDNVILNFADGLQIAGRAKLYRQDPLGINITAAGTGYTVGDALVFGVGTTTAVYRTAVGTVTAVDGGGGITAVTCTDMGAYEGGYPGVTIVGTGAGATFTCTSLAGPSIVLGDNLVAADIYEQGWLENVCKGAGAGTIIRRNWFGYTADVQVSNVYNTIYGVENSLDFKVGGTAANPILVYDNYMWGLRTNGGSPTAAITFHDVVSDIEIYNNHIFDCSSLFNLNTQYYRDRYSNDPGSTGGSSYPAWEGFTSVNFHDNYISDIRDFATSASYTTYQGRLFYSNNSLTYVDNFHSFIDYLAEQVVNVSAPAFVASGNQVPSTMSVAAYGALPSGWTAYTAGTTTTTTHSIPYTNVTVDERLSAVA